VTPREQLSAALKKARLTAGIDSQVKIARAINLTRTVAVKAESVGGPVPSDAVLVSWAKVTGADIEEFRELAERCRSGTPEWFMPYLGAEQSATRLRFWEPWVVPGLLQTEEYARALERSDVVVQQRMQRQQVINRAQVTAVISHYVLQRHTAPPGVMAEQCGRLAALVESEKILLHVLPEGVNVGIGGAVAIASKNGHVTVSLTTTVQDITSTEAALVEKTLSVFDQLLGTALGPVPSLEFIRTQEETWKGQT
jgi:hypothetical protein